MTAVLYSVFAVKGWKRLTIPRPTPEAAQAAMLESFVQAHRSRKQPHATWDELSARLQLRVVPLQATGPQVALSKRVSHIRSYRY